MRCQRHNRELVGACMWCGQQLCNECVAKTSGIKLYCSNCAAKTVVVRSMTPVAETRVRVRPAEESPALEDELIITPLE